MTVIVVGSRVAFYVLILKIDDPLFPGIQFLVDVVGAAYLYHQRPIHPPNTEARYDAIRNDAVAIAGLSLVAVVVAYLLSKKPVYAPRVWWN